MSDNSTTQSRVVVMTGATSGIGAAAVHHLAAEPDTRIIIGARGTGRTVPAGVEVIGVDLDSLDSIRAFAKEVLGRLGDTRIDSLVLNAGTQVSSPTGRTVDGFESIFGVNHLSHYLLARLLSPHVADGGRILLTTSDTHDPAVVPFAPRSLDPEALAHPAKKGGGMRAYTSSKLCNMMTTLSLRDLPELAEREVAVYAFNPGLTVGTNLGGRNENPGRAGFMERVMFPLMGVIGRFNPTFSPGKPERGGEVLAELADGTLTPPAGRMYASIARGEVSFPDPSELARTKTAREDLWQRSATMVGLPA